MGEASRRQIASSQGRFTPSELRCARKSATVFRDATRVSLKGSLIGLSKERKVPLPFDVAQNQQGQLPQVIISPHRAFPIGNPLTGRDMVPSIRTMIDGVKQKTLVTRRCAEIRFSEQRPGDGERCLKVVRAGSAISVTRKIVSQSKQALGGNCRRRTVNRLRGVKWISGFVKIFAELLEARSATVPHRNNILATVRDIEIGCGFGCLQHPCQNAVTTIHSKNGKVRFGQRLNELELLGKAADGPCQAAHPCGEPRI